MFNIKTACFMSILMTAGAQSLFGQFNIRIRPYLGVGIGYVLESSTPDIAFEDEYDQAYFDLNLSAPKRLFFKGHGRISLIHLQNFSLGYFFWGHHRNYADDSPGGTIKVETDYPHSENFTLHAATFEWRLAYPVISSESVVPYLLAGGGPFFGNFKRYRYEFVDELQLTADRIVSQTDTFEDWGYVIGGGLTLYRRFFIFIGVIDLQDRTLPTSRFFDMTLGVTL